jgi:hypothetical protein
MSNELDHGRGDGSGTPESANPFEAPDEQQSPGLFWSRERWRRELQLFAGFVLVVFVGFVTMSITCGGFMAGISIFEGSPLPSGIMFGAMVTSFVLSLAIPIWTMRRLWKAIKKSAEAANCRTLDKSPAESAGQTETTEQ